MAKYYVDFETRSGTSIDAGIPNYLADKESDIVCMAYRINNEAIKLWVPRVSGPFPLHLTPEDTFYAFNAQFDYQVWNKFAGRYNYEPISLDQCRDIQAMVLRCGFPADLDSASRVINKRTYKAKSGKALMKKICMPPYKFTAAEWKEFMRYAVLDVASMCEIMTNLPINGLSSEEQKVWLITARMNERGIPVDTYMVDRIDFLISEYIRGTKGEFKQLTGGYVTKHTQRQRIVDWCKTQGVVLPNLTAATVEEYVAKEDIPANVRRVLYLRGALGATSTAKYGRIKQLDHNGRVYGSVRYYGASTGRWSGLGFQPHNLPRAKVEDPEREIAKFEDRSILREDPIHSAKALIRAMICAKPGNMLVVADYASIENHILMWLCDEWEALQLINQGKSQYVAMAADLHAIPYESVNKDQRAFGKTLILGAGYNLGAIGFKAYAAGYGIHLTHEQAEQAISMYRRKHQKVVKYWYECKQAMLDAIHHPENVIPYGKCSYVVTQSKGRKWLIMTLPSGRALIYPDPEARDDKYGQLPTHMGVSNHAWVRQKLIPGRIIENIVQATARDILADLKMRMEMLGEPMILSVHDEIILEVPEKEAEVKLHDTIGMMRVAPKWAHGLPLDGEGYVAKRYRKD